MSSEVKQTQQHILRAMSLNYKDGTVFDRLDLEVLAAAADEISALEAENARLVREAKNDAIAYKAVLERQDELRAERDALATELAITRRVIDRIGQLCTTPHESKERFIRRVQSVIEWEAHALSAEASP